MKTLIISLLFFASGTSTVDDPAQYEISPLSGDQMFKMSAKVKENGLKSEAENAQRLDIWSDIIIEKSKDNNVNR